MTRPMAGPFGRDLSVMIAGPAGVLHLVTNPEDCSLCGQRGEVNVWNPAAIRDELTFELTPPRHRIWVTPCPVCRFHDFITWEAPQ
ncbi:hypothetical protein ACN268_22135 [Micromonospora sp. WMMD735]|uniref:hypothetical protein n=1 Tax=Micromonospora sp. WMMD735 TaxID=3404130 RepID=UPI003B95B951